MILHVFNLSRNKVRKNEVFGIDKRKKNELSRMLSIIKLGKGY